jgi:hypothetical protein
MNMLAWLVGALSKKKPNGGFKTTKLDARGSFVHKPRLKHNFGDATPGAFGYQGFTIVNGRKVYD